MPVIRMTDAMKISGMAAFEEANFEKRDEAPDSTWTGAVFPVERREAVERADLEEEPVFALLEEVFPEPERDIEVFAIISRCSLSP